MKPDKGLQELEAELLAIQKEKKALGLPQDLRQADLNGVHPDRLKAYQSVLTREVSCLQKMNAYITGQTKRKPDIN